MIILSEDMPQELWDSLPGAMVLHQPRTVKIGSETINLGTRQFWTPAAQVKDATAHVPLPGTTVVLEPVGEPVAAVRRVQDPEAPAAG